MRTEFWEAGVVGHTGDWGGGERGRRLSVNKSSSESIKAGKSLAFTLSYVSACLDVEGLKLVICCAWCGWCGSLEIQQYAWLLSLMHFSAIQFLALKTSCKPALTLKALSTLGNNSKKKKAIFFCSHSSTVNHSKNLMWVLHIQFLDDFTFELLLWYLVSIYIFCSCNGICSSFVSSWSPDAKTSSTSFFVNFHKCSLLSQSHLLLHILYLLHLL